MNIHHDHSTYAVPSEESRKKFVGSGSPELYMQSATTFPEKANTILARFGRQLDQFEMILDFGCGSGRLIRNLPAFTDAKLYGVDLDEEAIAFCRQNLPFGEFHVSQEYPHGLFCNGSMDFLYAFSVLTHLDEAHQDAWLAEWGRIVRPGGILFVTYKNEELLRKSNYTEDAIAEAREVMTHSGIYFRSSGYWKGQFPDFYQGAFHTDDYVRNHWGQVFNVLDLVPPGPVFAQSLGVLQRP